MAKSLLGAGLVGGLIGALLVGATGYFLAPELLGDRLVRETLLDQPEMLLEAGDVLRDRQFAPLIDANRDLFETPYGSSFKGAEDPQVVMVEFFDYACGYCRQTKPEIERLIKEMPDLKVVYRELPVLGPNSVVAAKASLAASDAGKFHQFHDKLFELGGPNAENIKKALQAAGLGDVPLDDPRYDSELQKNYELANLVNASGTPTFVIGNRVIPAAEGYDSYKAAIAAARRSNGES
ncbi:DsbA family protein [Sphingomicrobium lutaoense]|uniref:Protein-disulfide isomerase n=1 Tax=Sphingomicrobium lutaoense TaxID=515949 RepID=A0A839Z0M8_9SPHN|nr:DsbA family protein [Sphingomicrobium lutaoense]MBB3764240.1 protein-disulfide isomerase [Sphingomicrobium lutaoense]